MIVKACLVIMAIILYSIIIIDVIKIRKMLKNSVGKKVEEVIPEYNKFLNRNVLYLILATAISIVVNIF